MLKRLCNMHPLAILIRIIAIFIINIANVYADESPESIPNATKVNAELFIELANTLPDLVIVDSRIEGDRKKGYIEGSISLPDTQTSCKTLEPLIKQKSTPVLYYCNGIKCGRSVKAIVVAQNCGYNNIYWFRGGFEEWIEKGLPFLIK